MKSLLIQFLLIQFLRIQLLFIQLQDFISPEFPIILCASFPIITGLLNLSLPETLGEPLTQTVEEGQEYLKRSLCGLW